MTRDIAIAHKDYDVRGGGEVLARHLAKTVGAFAAFAGVLTIGLRASTWIYEVGR